MTGEFMLRRVGGESVFDSARAQIAEWERQEPDAAHVALVLDGKRDTIVTVTGEDMRPSDVAGLLFSAATVVIS